MKTCRQCKHNRMSIWSPFLGTFDECRSPMNPSMIHPVSGKHRFVIKGSQELRYFNTNSCTIEAKWFEPK